MKVLIVKPTALGDVAQAVPPVRRLARTHPAWKISWLVDEDYAPFLHYFSEIEQVVSFPRRRWRRRFCPEEWGSFYQQLRQARYDVAVDLQGLARSGLMTWATQAPRRVGLKSARELAFLAYNEIVQDDARHAVDRYTAAIRQVAGCPLLEISSPLVRADFVAPQSSKPRVLLHPYSLWDTKLWPWHRYAELARALPQAEFVLVGQGPFFPCEAPNVRDYRNCTDLEALLRLILESDVVVSTDSGPAHLAAAFGKPVLCLFGATDPQKTAPKGPRSRVLQAGVPCQPCMARECRLDEPMACMESLALGRVQALLEEILDSGS